MKYVFVAEHRLRFSVSTICRCLFAEVFNLALTGGNQEPIAFAAGGGYGWDIDRAHFAAQLADRPET